MIIAGCLVLNLSLPLWIVLGQRFGFHEKPLNNNRKADAWQVSSETKGNESVSKDDVLLKQLDDARSVVSGYSHAHSNGAQSTFSGASGLLSRAGTHLGFHHSPGDMLEDTASVFSGTSTFTDALLAARPKRNPLARRRIKTKQIVSTTKSVGDNHTAGEDDASLASVKRKLDVRMAAEFKKAEMEILENRGNQSSPTALTPNTTSSSDVDMGSAVDDAKSEAAPSILSKLDADAISVRDAVDAGGHLEPQKFNFERDRSHSGGRWSSTVERLMEAVDFDKEMKKFLGLAGHYSIQGILSEILSIVEIAFMGRFLGVRAVSAYIVVATITGFTGTITTGFYECAGVLIPQANGARNNILVGRYMQLAMIGYMVTVLPGALFWCFYTDDAVLWYKFDEETAYMAQVYIYATLPGYVTYGIDAVLWEFTNTIGKEEYATYFTTVSGLMHTGLVVGFLYGGVTDLFYIGLIETASDVICLFINFGFIWYKGWLDPYWEGLFHTNGLRDWRAVTTVVNTAVPLSCAWVLTYGEWEIMTLFCRHMSDTGAEVAAWGLVGYLWSAFETLTSGLGDAAEVRVGFRMGAGQCRSAKNVTDKALYVAFTTAMYCSGLLFILAMYVPVWLTPDKTLQKMIFDIIPLIGFGSIWMVWGMVAWAVLGAQGRIRIATILELFISWGIGAPIAAIFVYLFNYNIEGIIGGLTISYTIGTNVYLYMLYTSDWERLSANVVGQNAAQGKTYNEFDWNDLPDNIREAAIELGFNKRIWESDDDLHAESESKEWNELTDRERKAALLMGYTEALWNGTTEDGESSSEDGSTSEASSDGSGAWNNLSAEAQSAARILGYTKAIWENDGCPPTEDLDWEELSPAEQEAAQILGYNQQKWDGEEDDFTTASYTTPIASDAISTEADPNDTRNSIVSDSEELDSSDSPSTDRSVLEQIIASCSFDSNNDNNTVQSQSSVTGSISGRISSLLGYTEPTPMPEEATNEEASKASSKADSKTTSKA